MKNLNFIKKGWTNRKGEGRGRGKGRVGRGGRIGKERDMKKVKGEEGRKDER